MGDIEERFEPVSAAIKEKLFTGKEPVTVGIEGSAAAGKTTLAGMLKREFECNVWHMDDFFLQGFQRTPERLKEIGGNVDYERFYEEVVKKIIKKEPVLYRKFDCSDMSIGDAHKIEYRQLNIIEGIYSTHEYFGDIFDLKIFLDISGEEQEKRIKIRNTGETAKKFFDIWIPKEKEYIKKFSVKEKADIVIKVH